MMALDQGGQCRGVVLDLPAEDPATRPDRPFRREVTVKPINSMPRRLKVQTADGPLRALGFVTTRAFALLRRPRLPPEEVARTLARACGHWGSGAEYQPSTVMHLDARGIRCAGLWRMQALVAKEIDRMPAP